MRPPANSTSLALHLLALILVTPGLLVALAAPASAREEVVVMPGPGTPLQDAIDAAAPGTRIVLTPSGTTDADYIFRESIVIDKPLELVIKWDPSRSIGILPPCDAEHAVRITADDVRFNSSSIGSLYLRGGTVATLDVSGARRLVLRNLFPQAIRADCPSTATYAVRIDGSSRVTMTGGIMSGGQAAAIRISQIPEEGRVVLRRVWAWSAPVGFLLEDIAVPARRRDAFLLKNVETNFTDTGVLMRNVAGVRLSASGIYNSRVVGIHLDPTATGNAMLRNLVWPPFEPPPGAVDVLDEGSGNCWSRNRFTTGAVVQGPCP